MDELIQAEDLDGIRDRLQQIKEARQREENGRPQDLSLSPGQFLKSTKSRRRRSNLRKILTDPEWRPRLNKFLEYIEGGVSMNAAATVLNVRSDVISLWYHRGSMGRQGPKSGPYVKFFKLVHKALQAATAVSEVEVKKLNPLTWLTKGPGRLINEGWAVPDSINVQVAQQVEGDSLAIDATDLYAALRKLQESGVNAVGDIIEGQVLDAKDMDDEFNEGDRVSSQGTNYLENGHHSGANPLLPDPLQIPNSLPTPAVPQGRGPVQIDEELAMATNGQVIRPVVPGEENAADRLRQLLRMK